MTSCWIQRRDTKQICNHKIVFISGSVSLRLLAGSLPLGGDGRYFNGNNFNSTPDPGFVVMTSQWPSQVLSHHRLSPSCDMVSVGVIALTMWLCCSFLMITAPVQCFILIYFWNWLLTWAGEWNRWLLPHNNRDPWNINISLVDVFIFHSPVSTLPVIPLQVLIA